ncbi:cell surface protein [Methanosarcina siciliae HI350]|uniref:Cell surface protein n=1 Tax=Methanosarcina siciliae HI350 TaxID=1434119 RepID=A0A0E3PC51_9EURY|nr:cell surface protein [Methanosarcina siciliae HI350]
MSAEKQKANKVHELKQIKMLILLLLISPILTVFIFSDLSSAVNSENVTVTANFTVSKETGEAPLTVQFTDNSTGSPTAWAWEFGDGYTSTSQNPGHEYSKAGTYTITLMASNGTVSDGIVKEDYITVKEKPVVLASFSANTTSGKVPLTVKFTDSSSGGPASWNWDFNSDGKTDSTEQNPIYTYTTAGTYSVTLNAINGTASNEITKSNYINAGNGPTASFTATPREGEAPLTVQFNDSSTGSPTAWNWNFGDGTTSTKQNPSHTYSSAGKYTVELTVKNAYGSDTSEALSYIRAYTIVEPVADFEANTTTGPVPLTVQFKDKSENNPTAWEWDFNSDGNIDSTKQNPIYTYTTAGTYSVTLNAINGTASNEITKSNYITAGNGPTASFTAVPQEGEAPLEVQFTDTSSGSPTAWNWNFGDETTSTEQNPSHTYSSAGKYTVELTVKNVYGSDTSEALSYIRAYPIVEPTADFEANTTTGPVPLTVQFKDKSENNPTAWEWDFNSDGKTDSTEQNPVYTYKTAGTYSVTLNSINGTAMGNTTKTNYITVGELPVAAFNMSPQEGYSPLTVQFNDTSTGNVTSWLWDFGDGNTSTSQSPSHTYFSAGTYNATLTATNAFGSGTYEVPSAVNVLIITAPTPDFTSNVTSGKVPLTVQFEDLSTGGATAWEWDFNSDGNIDSTERNPVYKFTDIGFYTVTLRAGNGTAWDNITKSDYIMVGDGLHASFTVSTRKGEAPLTVQFNDTSTGNVTSWLWDFGDGNTSTTQNPSHEYTDSGTYSITLNASNVYGYSAVTWNDYIKVGEEDDSSGSGSSGGTSSGGGGGSPEPASNVEVKELSQEFVTIGDRIKFEFTKNATDITYVKFDSRRNIGKVTTIVEQLKGRSVLTPVEPSGKVCKYLNIWVGNEGFASPENIANALIGFRVKRTEITESENEGPTVFLYRYSEGKWNALPTRKTGEDSHYMYFESKTPGFSPFAIITGKRAVEYTEDGSVETGPLELSINSRQEMPNASSWAVPLAKEKDWTGVSTAIKVFVGFMVILLIGIAITEKKK